METDISTDPSDYSDRDDDPMSSTENDNKAQPKKRYDDESSDDYTDDDSSYHYSSEASYSDDDYLPNDIEFESLYNMKIKTEPSKSQNNTEETAIIDPIQCLLSTKNMNRLKIENSIPFTNNNHNHNTNTNNDIKEIKCKKEVFIDKIKCEICCDVFEYHSLFKKHMNKMHRIDKPYVCIKCPKHDQKRYQTKSSLEQHIEKIHEGIRNYQCHLCRREFYEKYALKYHLKAHENKNIQLLTCEYCNDVFISHPKYRKHMNEIHKIEQAYICKKCPKDKAPKYRSKAGLDHHIKRDHEGVRKHECKLCAKRFYEKQTLDQHQRVHDKKKPFQCTHCSLRFGLKHARKRHIMNIHFKQKPYECTYCGKKFAALGTMKSHVASIHDDEKYARFQCRTCHKKFYTKSAYYGHIDTAHRPKDPKKEMIKRGECIYPDCGKKYNGNKCAESVKYHLVAVHNDREYAKYECKKCKKLFYDKTRHSEHMEKHKKRKKKKRKKQK